jgi:hypothetical protein
MIGQLKTMLANLLAFDKTRVSTARSAHERAQKEATDARKRLDEAHAAVDAAEHAYDADPSDAAGEKVIAAKNARELAAVRAERASRREESARSELAGAEHAQEAADAAATLDEARKVESATRAALEDARAAAEQAKAGPAIAAVLNFTATKERETRAALDAASEMHRGALDVLVSAEERAADGAPEMAPALATVAEERRAEERARLVREGSPEAFRDAVAGDVEVIAACVRLIEAHVERVRQVIGAQQEMVRRAAALGAEVAPLDDAHAAVVALLALNEAKKGRGIGGMLTDRILNAFQVPCGAGSDPFGTVRALATSAPLVLMLDAWRAEVREGDTAERASWRTELDAAVVEALRGAPTSSDAYRAVEAVRTARSEKREREIIAAAEAEQRARKPRDGQAMVRGPGGLEVNEHGVISRVANAS